MQINFAAALLAALVAFVLGGLWYTGLFAKPRQEEIGMAKKGEKSNAMPPSLGKLLGVSFVLELIMAINLAAFIGADKDWQFGLLAGLAAGLGWVAMALGVNYLFEGKSFKLWLINASYNVVTFSLMGLIIGAM